MTWTSLSFAFGSLLTGVKMTQLSDNITALANGDSGAPKITNAAFANNSIDGARLVNSSVDTAQLATDAVTTGNITNSSVNADKIAGSAVHQGELNTSQGEVSTSVANKLVLPGGQYGFYPQVKHGTVSTTVEHLIYRDNSGTVASYTTYIYIDPGDDTAYAQQRYVNSSPPYDLGDGEIPLFIFLFLDSQGNVKSTYAADAPPWAYNGPSNAIPDFVDPKSGKKYKVVTNLEHSSHLAGVSLGDLSTKADFDLEALEKLVRENPYADLVEITQDIKNADMPLIPHPFGKPKVGHRVVLLDPMWSSMGFLKALQEGGASIADLVKNYLVVGNEELSRCSPPGVLVPSVKWKNTKG